jgi:phage-related minor tail protein
MKSYMEKMVNERLKSLKRQIYEGRESLKKAKENVRFYEDNLNDLLEEQRELEGFGND